jgi:hypothetical protein
VLQLLANLCADHLAKIVGNIGHAQSVGQGDGFVGAFVHPAQNSVYLSWRKYSRVSPSRRLK